MLPVLFVNITDLWVQLRSITYSDSDTTDEPTDIECRDVP